MRTTLRAFLDLFSGQGPAEPLEPDDDELLIDPDARLSKAERARRNTERRRDRQRILAEDPHHPRARAPRRALRGHVQRAVRWRSAGACRGERGPLLRGGGREQDLRTMRPYRRGPGGRLLPLGGAPRSGWETGGRRLLGHRGLDDWALWARTRV